MNNKGIRALLALCFIAYSQWCWSDDKCWMAIWPIDTISYGDALTAGEADTIRYLVPDLITASLTQANYQVVEREKLLELLTEQNLGSSELADESSRLQLGRLLGAQYMLFGQYTKLGTSWQLDLRVVHTESGKVIATASADQQQGELVSIAEKIGLTLIPGNQHAAPSQ